MGHFQEIAIHQVARQSLLLLLPDIPREQPPEPSRLQQEDQGIFIDIICLSSDRRGEGLPTYTIGFHFPACIQIPHRHPRLSGQSRQSLLALIRLLQTGQYQMTDLQGCLPCPDEIQDLLDPVDMVCICVADKHCIHPGYPLTL